MPRTGENIYHRKDGRWEGRCKVGYDERGKLRYRYIFGHSAEEVKKKMSTVKQCVQPKITVQPFDPIPEGIAGSFAATAAEWRSVSFAHLKQSSVVKYSNILRKYLLPAFQYRQIERIDRHDVVIFVNELLRTGGPKQCGLAPKTVSGVLSVMKNIFDYASKEKKLNVADINDIPLKPVQGRMRILSHSEQEKLSNFLRENLSPCNLGILTCMYTGLRIGEICALRWEDISMNDHMLFVRRSMQRVACTGMSASKTEVIISTPKSVCSIRNIPLPDDLFNVLVGFRQNDESFLLTGSENEYVEPRTLQYRFQAILRDCEIDHVNFHALRHTFATRCVELGFDIKTLSEILGHASVSITMNRYVHPPIKLKQENMNKWCGIVGDGPALR